MVQSIFQGRLSLCGTGVVEKFRNLYSIFESLTSSGSCDFMREEYSTRIQSSKSPGLFEINESRKSSLFTFK